MPKVAAIQVEGLELLFYSSDHRPPHYHARKPGKWEIRVFIDTCRPGHLSFDMKFPKHRPEVVRKRDMESLLAKTLEHRVALLQEWEDKVFDDA